MKAVGVYQGLPIEDKHSLEDVDIAIPVPKPHDLLVKIKAISVNPVDTKLRMAINNAKNKPQILGFDAVGVVEAVGSAVTLFSVGAEVYFAGDVTRQGNYADYTCIDERLAGRKPSHLTDEEAAAMPLTTITAWEALHDRLKITAKDKGKTILIINGAGGVGSIAIQLAKLAGLRVITTASRPETIDWVKSKGADQVIDHHHDLVAQLKEADKNTVDYILCLYDPAQHFQAMMQLIKAEGEICTIVSPSKPIDIQLLKDKSVAFHYEYMFTRAKYKTESQIRQHDILNQASELFNKGKLESTLTNVLEPFCADVLRKAHAQVESGKMIGKLVVKGFTKRGE